MTAEGSVTETPPPAVRRRFWIALGASALAHALLVLAGGRFWSVELPEVETRLPPPMEAVLLPAPPPASPAAPEPAPPPAPKPKASATPKPPAAPKPTTPAAPLPPPAARESTLAEPVAAAAADSTAAAPEPGPPSPPAARPLPRRIEIKYALTTGEEGVELGAVYGEWTLEGDRYVARAVAEATGLLALFFSSQVVAESRGTLTAAGLRPELFVVQRGALERTEVVQFNWQAMFATMTSAKGTERVGLRPGAQDQLSFMFQFPFAYPGEQEYLFHVLTGRKADHYTYRVQGDEQLSTFVGPFRTLRLERLRQPGDRSVDAWLAVEFYHLPVRLRLTDKSGQTADLIVTALSIEP